MIDKGRKQLALHHTFHRARLLAKKMPDHRCREKGARKMWMLIVPTLLAVLFLLVAGYARLVTLSPEDKLAEDEEQETWCRKHYTDRKNGK